MTTIREAADSFLAHKRIAVTGVSRNGAQHGANVVYQRLRERGYEVDARLADAHPQGAASRVRESWIA